MTEIRKIDDHTHPAHTQFGLFALYPIPNDTLICDYVGVVHSSLLSLSPQTTNLPPPTKRADPWDESDYCVRFGTEEIALHETVDGEVPGLYEVCIDAAQCGNEARFVNDYRGVAIKPNAEFRTYVDISTGNHRLGIFAKMHSLKPPKGSRRAEHQTTNTVAAGRHKKQKVNTSTTGMASPRLDSPQATFIGIPSGTEILVSYGKGFWKARNLQHGNDNVSDWDCWNVFPDPS
ncbi:hypothetical protein HDU93_004217, partial [Gonapodya sp. JEL0774]